MNDIIYGVIKLTFTAVEYANTAIATVEYLVPLEGRIAVGFYPDAGHGVVENFILFE